MTSFRFPEHVSETPAGDANFHRATAMEMPETSLRKPAPGGLDASTAHAPELRPSAPPPIEFSDAPKLSVLELHRLQAAAHAATEGAPIGLQRHDDAELLNRILGGLPKEGKARALSPADVRALHLYFADIPAAQPEQPMFVACVNGYYVALAVVRQGDDTLIEPTVLRPRDAYGKEARELGKRYRLGDSSEAERVADARRYTRASRSRCSTVPEFGLKEATPAPLAGPLPVITDRAPRLALLSLVPEGARTVIHSVGANYLESYLDDAKIGAHGVETLNLDVQIDDDDAIARKLGDFKPDVIGISTKTLSADQLASWMERLQREYPDSALVLGGTLATYAFGDLIEDYPRSIVVVDNGEEPMARLMRIVAGEKPLQELDEIPNLVFRRGDAVTMTRFKDLNTASHFKPSDSNVREIIAKDGILALRWSQGCWGNCTFCSLPGKWKGVSADDIISVLKHWHEEYGIKGMFFTDDEVVPKEPQAAYQRLDEFCDKLIAAKLDITWTVSLRADCIHWMDKALADKLKAAGCCSFFIGVESGSSTQLRRYGKWASGVKIDASVNAQALRFFRDNGISIGVGWIPFDPAMATLREVRENLAFAQDTELHRFNVRFDNALRVQRGAADVSILGSLGLGLLGELQPNLLFYDSTYVDPRVGAIKDHVMAWVEDVRAVEATVHSAKFEAAVDPTLVKGREKLLTLGQELARLAVEYQVALTELFPDSDDDRRLDTVDPEKDVLAPEAKALLADREFMAERRQGLVAEVTSKRLAMREITDEFSRRRAALIREAIPTFTG